MRKHKPQHIILVELGCDGDTPSVHCPVRGKSIFGSKEHCPHLLFFHESLSGFEFEHPKFKKAFEVLQEEYEGDPIGLASTLGLVSERAFRLSVTKAVRDGGSITIVSIADGEVSTTQKVS